MMADRFAVCIKNNGVAPTIADDRPVPSVQSKTPALVLFDKIPDRFAHLWRCALLRTLHGKLLCEIGVNKGENYWGVIRCWWINNGKY